MWCVYMHTLFDGRKYIGITSQKLARRWRNEGKGYKKQVYFWNAIKKYGWNNFKHDILFENLTKNQACLKEQALIKLFDTTDHRYGFNLTTGGEFCEWSEQSKEKIRKIIDKDELIQYYIVEDHTVYQCASHFGCSRQTIRKNIHQYCLSKEGPQYTVKIAKDELYYQYIVLNKTVQQCADHFGCGHSTITKRLKEYNIKKDTHVVNYREPNVKINKKELIEYLRDHSIRACGRHFGCFLAAIRWWMKKYNIEKEK